MLFLLTFAEAWNETSLSLVIFPAAASHHACDACRHTYKRQKRAKNLTRKRKSHNYSGLLTFQQLLSFADGGQLLWRGFGEFQVEIADGIREDFRD